MLYSISNNKFIMGYKRLKPINSEILATKSKKNRRNLFLHFLRYKNANYFLPNSSPTINN